MTIIVYIFSIFMALLSLYLGILKNRLNLINIYRNDKRFSIKRLNKALSIAKDDDEQKLVLYVKKVYQVYLVSFYVLIIFIIAALFNGW